MLIDTCSRIISVKTDCSKGRASSFWAFIERAPVSDRKSLASYYKDSTQKHLPGSVTRAVSTSTRTAWNKAGSLTSSINAHVAVGRVFEIDLCDMLAPYSHGLPTIDIPKHKGGEGPSV
jgi:hypothetical protein